MKMLDMIEKTGDSSLFWCKEQENGFIRALSNENAQSHENRPIIDPLAI
jgi:hypothetical protein